LSAAPTIWWAGSQFRQLGLAEPQDFGTGVALLEPKAVHEVVLDYETMERVRQDYLVVRELGRFQRVLAVVEVLSPGQQRGAVTCAAVS
jgi:hypothetical protein